MLFKVKLCECIFEIETVYKYTYNMCKEYEYVGAEAPAFRVCITQDDVEKERKISASIDRREGREVINYSDGYLEALSVYRKIAYALATQNIILFHGSTVEIDGKGYVFAAPSGTGKSTFSRNLRSILGDKVIMINDDKPLIKSGENGTYAYGTPWNGKHNLGTNKSVPLDSIYVLERSSTPWIRDVTFKEVFSEVFIQTYKTYKPTEMEGVLNTLDSISRSVKFYRMGITLDTRTAELFTKMIISE